MKILLKWPPVVLPMLVFILQLLMGWVLWSLRQKYVSHADCNQCRGELVQSHKNAETRISELERGHTAHEAAAAYQVTTGDLEKIYGRINSVDRKVSDQSGELRAMRRELGLINQHLLEK